MVNQYLGKDIYLKENQIQFSTSQDFATVDDNNNLQQAIFNRLKTVLGEYFNVNYGSRLNEVIGGNRGELLRGQIIGYVAEALNQEPRIQRIENIEVEYPTDYNIVNINITVIPISSNIELNLVFPYFLD
jgi:phage baseplate assembly protein W